MREHNILVFTCDFTDDGEIIKNRLVKATRDNYELVCEEAIDEMIDVCACHGIWAYYMADRYSFEQAKEDFANRVLAYKLKQMAGVSATTEEVFA